MQMRKVQVGNFKLTSLLIIISSFSSIHHHHYHKAEPESFFFDFLEILIQFLYHFFMIFLWFQYDLSVFLFQYDFFRFLLFQYDFFMTSFQLGESCLHAGCKYGHTAVVEYLVSIHTNIDLQDSVSFYCFLFRFSFYFISLDSLFVSSPFRETVPGKTNRNLKTASLLLIYCHHHHHDYHHHHDESPAQGVWSAHCSVARLPSDR